MGIILQKIKAIYNIGHHLLRNRVVVTNPLRCSRVFMERTSESHKVSLRFGTMRFFARKQDMNAVIEVLVSGGYDTVVPFLSTITNSPVILDCGANIGSFALRVLKERPDAKIVSIEAAEDTFSILADNKEMNLGSWHTVHAAIWGSNGQLALDRQGSSVMHTVREATAQDNETIPARSLKSIKDEFGITKVDIIKIDIEGAESVVIPSSPDDVEANLMIIEIHKNLSDPTECCEILAQMYPYAFVCREQLHDKTFPNVVYYLSKIELKETGMVAVDLMDHLRTVYIPEMWQK